MLKTKKIKIPLIVWIIIFLVIVFVLEFINLYKEFGIDTYSTEEFKKEYQKEYTMMSEAERELEKMKPIEYLTNEEIEEMISENTKSTLIMVALFAAFMTLLGSIIPIALFIAINISNKRFQREKLNKDDHYKSKQYYRDIIENCGICEISWIDDFELEEKDIVAELLQLENKKIIKVNEGKIIINPNYDREKLKSSQLYILDNIRDGKVKNINVILLREKVKEDALQDGLIEERQEWKKRQIINVIKSIITFIILYKIVNYIFSKCNGKEAEGLIVLVVLVLLVIAIFYPIVAFASLVITSVAYHFDPYFRTKKGKKLNKKIEGLKIFLKDYTLLDERKREDVVIWEDYLVYSVLFNQNKKIIEEYKKYLQ